MDLPSTGHESVMLQEVLEHLRTPGARVIVDCTTGRGGHALEMAKRLPSDGLLIGLDVDEANLTYARQRLGSAPCAVRLFQANFAQLEEVLAECGVERVHGILADLGVSTNQLFEPRYGLSFVTDMPLDMRLDASLPRTAGDLVNHLEEEELANVLYSLAQEHYSRRIARKIVEARRVSPITTTGRLAEVVRSAIPRRGYDPERIDPATRTFLALRMAVNREMENLPSLLEQGPRRLERGGRMAVISFQSMEDRLAKQAFRSLESAGDFQVLTRKPLTPTDAEAHANPRARSAKLRVIERLR